MIYNDYSVSSCIPTQLLVSEHTFKVYLSSKISTLKANFDQLQCDYYNFVRIWNKHNTYRGDQGECVDERSKLGMVEIRPKMAVVSK